MLPTAGGTERALQEAGGVKASRAGQRTATAAKGQEEEVCLFFHTQTQARGSTRGTELLRAAAGLAPVSPDSASGAHTVGYGDNEEPTGLPRPTFVPSKRHPLLLPFLLLTVNADMSTSGAAKDLGPLWILQHLPAWRGQESSRGVTRCPGNQVGGLISRRRSSLCSFAATRERVHSWLSPPSLLCGEEGHSNITHGEQKPLTLLI